MPENKTQPTNSSVEEYFAAIDDAARRRDCEVLAGMMGKATKQQARMWGTGIVGFGSCHYTYESGREGDMCLVGFSSRKGDISLYLTADVLAQAELLAKLGRHKAGKGCLYLRRLDDIDSGVLEQLIAGAVAQRMRTGGC